MTLIELYVRELITLNISDIIEQYLKKILQEEEKKMIEIKRSQIADQFQCVPSQINYVINTRFTMEKGYIIESKRGGGGYIRIVRIEHLDELDLINDMIDMIYPKVSEQAAYNVVDRLLEKKIIFRREHRIILAAINNDTLVSSLAERDYLRSRILTNVLTKLKYVDD